MPEADERLMDPAAAEEQITPATIGRPWQLRLYEGAVHPRPDRRYRHGRELRLPPGRDVGKPPYGAGGVGRVAARSRRAARRDRRLRGQPAVRELLRLLPVGAAPRGGAAADPRRG